MKKLIITTILLMMISLSFSQTKEQISEITKNYNVEKIENLAKKYALDFKEKKEYAIKIAKINNWATIIKTKTSIKELIQVVDNKPIYYTTSNVAAAKSTRANTLHNGGLLNLNIEGQNMTAYVWDGGIARATHQEYDGIGGNNRYSIIDGGALGLSFHAAHVTGTIISSGFQANAKGMAPQASAKGADWNNDFAEVTQQTLNGMLVSNHSYGMFANQIPDWWFGAYTNDSRTADQIMYNAPFYLMVAAAGNDGNDNSSNAEPLDGNSGFDKISGKECAKNALIVANAQDANIDANGVLLGVNINSSSSQGPMDDYRIKPDITGNGTNLYSTFETADDAYNTISGTSMASPNVTGTLLLLQQYYNNLNGNFMKAATLKGLALHTADDLGINGPDAVFGWGLLNAKKAAETITQNGEYSVIEEITLSPGQIYSTSVTSDGLSKLIASISWTDPAGQLSNGTANDTTPALVNDLDIRITQNANTSFPYKLTSVNTNTTADNIVDPFERIDIDGANGSYTITVTHKGALTNGSQNFSLIITGLQFSGNCTANDPTNLNASLLFGTANFTWDNITGATYELRYRPIGDTTWTTLTTANENLSVSGLSGVYVAQVRSICNGTSFSNWVTFQNFPSFVLKTNDYFNKNSVIVYSENSTIIIKSIDSNIISNVSIYSLLGKKLYNNSPNKENFMISKSEIGDERFVIVRVLLENGNIINKKILI